MVNSFFPWIGGKKQMREIILERFPAEYGRYVEVFGGAAWILFGKEPEPFEVYNDLNSDLTNMFRVVKEKPLAFLKELGFLPLNGRQEFEIMLGLCKGEDFSIPNMESEMELAEHWLPPLEFEEYREMMETKAEMGDVRRAANFYKLIRYSYAGGSSSFNSQPMNLMQTCRTIWQANRRLNENGVKDRAAVQKAGGAAGRGVIIENKNYEELITQYDREDTFFYLDPPYVGTEKNYAVRVAKMFHKHLCSLLKKIKGKFMLSYNDCPEVREMYGGCGFYIESFDRLNSISQRYNPGGQFRELLVMNYNPYERRDKQPKQMTLAM